MGQSVSSSICPPCSNSVSPIYGDYEQLKSEADSYPWKSPWKSQEEDTSCYIRTRHQDFRVPFELGRNISCTFSSDDFLGITISSQKFCGIRVSCPAKDTHLIQRIFPRRINTMKDLIRELFEDDDGCEVQECRVTIVNVDPPKPPSQIQEVADEDLSPQESVFPVMGASESTFSNVQTKDDKIATDVKELLETLDPILEHLKSLKITLPELTNLPTEGSLADILVRRPSSSQTSGNIFKVTD